MQRLGCSRNKVYFFMNVIKDNKGITLIEIVVSVSIFSFAMLSLLGIFNFVLENQRNSISSQNVQEGVRYALEMMAKEIRAADSSDTECYAVGTKQIFNSPDQSTLYFKNKYGVCTTYFLGGGRIQVVRGAGGPEFLTGNKVRVDDLKFKVTDNDIGTPPGSRIQPKITVLIELNTTIGRSAASNRMKIQTTVSSRVYE